MLFPRLQQTSSSYYLRIVILQDLRQWFPVTEIRRSLKTSDKKSAKLLATKWADKVDSLFAKIRAGIFFEEQIQELIQRNLP